MFLKGCFAMTLAATTLACGTMPAHAQKALATGDVNYPDIVAEVTECKRSEGTLTVKIRLRNTGENDTSFYIVSARRYDDHYVTAKQKKYLMLRDAEKKPLAPAANPGGDVYVGLKKGGVWTWWAKFPAPPADVSKVEYTWPIGTPISDIPCSDA
jgi:hypothetical protein